MTPPASEIRDPVRYKIEDRKECHDIYERESGETHLHVYENYVWDSKCKKSTLFLECSIILTGEYNKNKRKLDSKQHKPSFIKVFIISAKAQNKMILTGVWYNIVKEPHMTSTTEATYLSTLSPIGTL